MHESDLEIPITHIATITWAPSQPWHRVVHEIKQVLDRIEDDAEVEHQADAKMGGEPVLFLSFPRGPLVEFREEGVLTFGRDATGELVVWSGPRRRQTPLGSQLRRAADEKLRRGLEMHQAADRRIRELALTAFVTGAASGVVVALVAAMNMGM